MDLVLNGCAYLITGHVEVTKSALIIVHVVNRHLIVATIHHQLVLVLGAQRLNRGVPVSVAFGKGRLLFIRSSGHAHLVPIEAHD